MKQLSKIPNTLLTLLLVSGSSVFAQESAPPADAVAPPPDAVVAAPAAEAAPEAAVAEVAVDAAEVDVTAADDSAAPAAAAEPAEQAAPPASLSVAEILRRPPAEWDALIEQKVAELQQQQQANYPTYRSPWADPYASAIESRMDAMERRMENRYRQLRRRVDVQQRMIAPAWANPAWEWSEYQRKLSRLQSLAEQERYNKMMQRYMRRVPRYGGPWGR